MRELEAEPEAIAHHFTQAGLDDLAIEWWGKAGDQALRRSAFQEAIAHLGKAIAMADRAGEPGSTSKKLKLRADYGVALSVSRGVAAEETRAAAARTKQLAAELNDPAERFPAYRAQIVADLIGGRIGSAISTAETYLREARNAGAVPDVAFGCYILGQSRMYQGALAKAGALLEESLRTDPGPNIATFNVDWTTFGIAVLSILCWLSGEIERARALIEQAKERANKSRHGVTLANTYYFASTLEGLRGDAEASLRDAEILAEIAEGIGYAQFSDAAKLRRLLAQAQLGDREAGLQNFRETLTEYRKQTQAGIPFWLGSLAEFEAEGGSADTALQWIDEALALAEQTDQRWTNSRLHCIRGDILMRADPENPARAEKAYRAAIAIAREQGARSFGLRAALRLANLYRSTARPVEAHDALAPALEGFSAAPEMPEIAEAQVLLAALAQTEEVKADVTQRRRAAQLRVAYGNALFAARGPAAPETTKAFARARNSGLCDKDAPGRLAADFGLWGGSYVRGELSPMRAYAAALLRDVEARPNSPEAGVAHRASGVTHWFAGEYREAREDLERALALFQPGRDDDLAFRFGNDAGVGAMLYLALALWPLGDIERAVSLIGDAEARIAGLAFISTRAYGKMHASMFELMRGDLSQTALNAHELSRLSHEHDLPFPAFGVFLEGLASAQSGPAGGGLEDMRRGVELLREQNILIFDGLIKIALAEAESRAGDVDRALAILNEALATSERIGHRTFDGELHRVRGEILLKRDPSNPAPAEEAFQSAIAIAKQQSTRSFGLRAALSLAKLYRSTRRPVDAHDILAPALEGFAPTPEMPEIAEAQALLAALGETDEVKAQCGAAAANDALAGRLWQRAGRDARLRRARNDGGFRQSSRVVAWREGRARSAGCRLGPVGRQP